METQKGSTLSTVIMAVIVGIVLAGGGLLYINNHKAANPTTTEAMTTPTTDTKSADLRVLLNALERQHVDLASAATRNGFSGNPDFQASAQALDKNSQALGDAIGQVYGPDAEKQFLVLWRRHITDFVNYTVAAKKGDKAGMQAAVADLGGYIQDTATFFSSANPNLPKDAVAKLLTEHVTLLKQTVDTYAAGDYAGSYDNQGQAYTQVGTIADTMSGAIVKQSPNKFE